jgi:hypothetical protein
MLGGPVHRDNLLGFQFLDDGSMWAAIADQTAISFEHYTSGPSGPSTAAYTLMLGGPVHRDNLLDFQFIEAPVAGVVPEPSTWAMMIVGFGLAGAGLRMRRLHAAGKSGNGCPGDTFKNGLDVASRCDGGRV